MLDHKQLELMHARLTSESSSLIYNDVFRSSISIIISGKVRSSHCNVTVFHLEPLINHQWHLRLFRFDTYVTSGTGVKK